MSSGPALRRLQVLQSHLDHIGIVCSDDTSTELNEVKARLLNTSRAITLIGSMILDATPGAGYAFKQGGSVPGHVKFVPGGVARNIAHSLVLLAISERTTASPLPLLITAVGDDAAGKSLLDSCISFKMDTRGIISVPGGATPCVSIIFDGGGDVAASVADVALLENQLTAPQLSKYTRDIERSHSVLIDGDLSQDAMEAVCSVIRNCSSIKRPLLFFEPVSAPKSTRAVPFLSVLDYASPNLDELKAMAGSVLKNRGSRTHKKVKETSSGTGSFHFSEIEKSLQAARPLLQLVLEEGLGNVVLTLGSLGAALCTLTKDKSSITVIHAPALPATIVNCSGAGDCLVAGFLHGLTHTEEDPIYSLAMGIAAAKHAVQSDSNVPLNLTASDLAAQAINIVKQNVTNYSLPRGCCCELCCAM